ncbi:hypothetical protein NC661_04020 [Aquibacillus koreensis]|uniref:Uncharacterized protein n=1 Tax=Aquibacillus koreensis TaxID=279446 RepID=A0A9X4AIP2_9BACI|nr:hypothetical protein [Aquibacillus koreensis]MCT2534861.1 hypothetical protein [Aquibacillus koreensis]MDC3419528.1 hypothetical protein [Aquibacillus koreensis]
MRKDNFKWLIMLGSLLGIIGLLFIFFSNNLGASLAEGWLVENEYEMSDYLSEVKKNTSIFIVTGSILLGIGLSTVVFAFYKVLNIKD